MAWSHASSIGANSPIAQLPNSPEDLSSSNSPNSLIGQLAGKKINIQEADRVMESIVDLVPQDSNYRPKYYAALYRMGPALFVELADRARKGRSPQHLFRVLVDGRRK